MVLILLQGNFTKGIPEGECTFALRADRTMEIPQTAAAFVLAEDGPTLKAKGVYKIPEGLLSSRH